MTTLADDIEALRLKMVETAEEERHLVDTLGQRLAEADVEILRALEQIVVDQEHRRRNISDLLSTIASRVGHVPRATAPPPLPAHRVSIPIATAQEFDAAAFGRDIGDAVRAVANGAGVH